MNEHLAGWLGQAGGVDLAGHWLAAWTIVIAAVVVLRAVCRPRRASVRYGGWLLATFSGVGLLLIVLAVSPVVTWQEIAGRFGWTRLREDVKLVDHVSFGFETDASPRDRLGPLAVGAEPSVVPPADERATPDRPAVNSTSEPDSPATSMVTKPDRSGISVVSIVFWAWLAGVCFFLSRLARHCWLAHQLVRPGLASTSRETKATYHAMRRRLGMVRDVRLAVHDEITTPVCVGAVRPVILWPSAENDRFNRRQRAAAMAHELAHLRRYDEWVNLASEFWRAVTWFFPPVHWTIARFRREQEFLCDDLAARELNSPADYADMLLKLTPVRLGPNVLCFTMEPGLEASRRVRRLIDPKLRCVLPPSRFQIVFLAILGLSLVTGAGALRLVGFSNRTMAVAASTERDTPAGLETRAESDATNGGDTAADKQTIATAEKQGPRPRVVEVYPPDGADGVAPDTEIRVRFDRPMDPVTSLIQWEHDSEGGFRPRGAFRYLKETHEFILPVRLTPGCSHQVTINRKHYFEEGAYTGFSSIGQVAAEPYSWSFATADLSAAVSGRRPKVVAVEPPSNSEISMLTLLRVKFDEPMDPTWYGLAHGGNLMNKPQLLHFVEYDSENHEFTLPLKLPGNWNGDVELMNFRSTGGVEAEPIRLEYRTKREVCGAYLRERATLAGKSPELVALVDGIRAARAELTSVSEEIRFATVWGSKPGWLDRYECQGATFKMQGDRRFMAKIDQIMGIPFRVGSDGSRCWYRNKDEIVSCRFEEVAEKNVLFGDPFRAGRLAVTASLIRDMKLEYLGRVMLEGRACHRIRSWDVKLLSKISDYLMPVRDWYIDAESLLTVRIENDGLLHMAFDYLSVNEPIPSAEFQPETVPGIEIQEPEPLDEDYTRRYLNIVDGSNGRMSVRWGKKGPKGSSSGGLN